MRTAITRVLLVVVMAVAGIVVGGQGAAQAACNGSGCAGLDPQAQGCSASASNLTGTGWETASTEVVRYVSWVRTSSTCNARWTRVEFTANPCCFTFEIAVETQRLLNSNWVALDFRTATVGAGVLGANWTDMVENRSDDRVRSCVRLVNTAWRCGNWAA
ncbi:hypothetical protein [Lentzea sp. NPDC059081]|uniref:hypothetical protein n=1 Tax=Lentzea sp. NPDC059081 TaxID=3346719 RepID=UPI0036B9F21D